MVRMIGEHFHIKTGMASVDKPGSTSRADREVVVDVDETHYTVASTVTFWNWCGGKRVFSNAVCHGVQRRALAETLMAVGDWCDLDTCMAILAWFEGKKIPIPRQFIDYHADRRAEWQKARAASDDL
jgi:hypothetical protein